MLLGEGMGVFAVTFNPQVATKLDHTEQENTERGRERRNGTNERTHVKACRHHDSTQSHR